MAEYRNSDVYVISLANDLQRSELAIKGHYFFEGEESCIYLMASSESGVEVMSWE